LMPSSTAQVSEIVRLCSEAGVGVVPYSGGTGVVAGQLSIEGDNAVILSLEKMNTIREVSSDDAVMVAEAGCILENVHAAALEADMIFPLSMASKGSCCIGGNLATNAGGIQVLRYGNARDLCLGVEASADWQRGDAGHYHGGVLEAETARRGDGDGVSCDPLPGGGVGAV